MCDDPRTTQVAVGHERLDPLPALSEEEYLAEVLRSAPRLDLLTQPCEALLLGALGLCGAAGEVVDLVKQHCYHAHPLDRARLMDELGKVLWSLTWLCHTLDTSLGAVLLSSMTRLQAARPRPTHRQSEHDQSFPSWPFNGRNAILQTTNRQTRKEIVPMDHENQTPNEHDDPASPATELLVLSQMRHHAARPIAFPPARAGAVWDGDDPLLCSQINRLLDDLDDDDALPPPTADPADVAAPVAAPLPAAACPDAAEPERPDAPLSPTAPPTPRRRPPGLLGGILLLVALGALLSAYVVLFPQIVPQATVTLTPTSATLSTSLVVTAQPGGVPVAARHEVAARLLAVTSPVKLANGTTSGTSHQQARAAFGTLTFYNAAPYGQTIAAGTVVTGVDGIAVATERGLVLPPGNPPTFGIASVSAHARVAGPQGNLAPLALDGLCCLPGVSVKNTSAFGGGSDARTFPVATQADLTRLSAPLIAALSQSAQAQLEAEVRPSEQLVSLVACTPQVRPDHPLGSPAARLAVTVSVTCRGETYDQGAVTALAEQQLNQQAAWLGPGYAQVGTSSTSVTQQVTTDPAPAGTLVLLVAAQGTWAYQFTSAALHEDARLLEGKSLAQARALLLSREAGHLRQVVIHLSGWWSDGVTLPDDTSAIHLLVVIVP